MRDEGDELEPRAVDADPRAFFEERGFVLVAYEVDGASWADLVARDNPDFRVRRYGRGDDPPGAARAAVQRWIVEQAT